MNQRYIKRFLRESNAIESMFTRGALDKALKAWKYIKDKKNLGEKELLEAHDIMCRGVIDDDRMPGQFRDHDVWIGNKKCPDADEAKRRMEEWLERYGDSEKVSALMDRSLPAKTANRSLLVGIHIDFELIHVFSDGNGRIGRLLMLWHFHVVGQEAPLFTNMDKHELYYPLFRMRDELGII